MFSKLELAQRSLLHFFSSWGHMYYDQVCVIRLKELVSRLKSNPFSPRVHCYVLCGLNQIKFDNTDIINHMQI